MSRAFVRGAATAVLGSLVVAAGASGVAATVDYPLGDAVRGQQLYEGKCGGCHSVDANRIGPMHRGVVGRKPGSVPGFDYSPGVKALKGVWTPARIDKWLQGPQDVAPSARMFFTVPVEQDRRDIIAYLVKVSPPKKA